MGKKRRIRIKKNSEEKQGHNLDDKPRNTSRDLEMDIDMNMDDIINSLHSGILHQIIPLLLHKWNHQEEEHDLDNITTKIADNMDPNDFISRLPNNILNRIISLLPFESAVRTTFLSTQWKGLWKEALLTLVRDATMEDAVTAISSFLDDFDTQHRPRNKWGFKFKFGHGRVLLASIAPNNSLQLDFSAGKQEYARPFDWSLKLNLSSCNSCTYRSTPYIFNWIPEEYGVLHTAQPFLEEIKVKSLYLVSVSYPFIEAISSMVLNFSFLRSLTIAKRKGLRSLRIKEARGLYKLVVLDCPQLESLYFHGSCLRSFQYRGRLISFKFEVSSSYDGPSMSFCYQSPYKFHLTDAMLDFRQGPPIYDGINCDGLKSIIECIKDVESLTLCRWVFEPLISYMLPSLRSDLEFRLRWLRELWWPIDPKSYTWRSTKVLSTKVSRLGKLDNLKLLKLEGFANENMEIFFAKRLKPLFKVKAVLILAKSKGGCLRRLVKAPELEKEGKYPYMFKEVKSFHGKHPDHVHMKV
ncbi:hypothetical protein PTKIN_Ptkin13bG0184400 [Pterospermum kingtungense]